MLYDDRLQLVEDRFSDKYIESFSDGEETAFNMVTALCGTMYMSGHIEYADELNKTLISDAVRLFKKYRLNMIEAYPFWPLGLNGLNDHCWNALGFLNVESGIITLAVWKIYSEENECTFDLSKRLKVGAYILDSFPEMGVGIQYSFNPQSLSLSLKSEKSFSAVWISFKNVQ